MVLDKYNAALDARAAVEREKAEQARQRGDEREMSLRLMRASMLGDMLKQLGKVDHQKIRPGLLQQEIDHLCRKANEYEARQDYDAADQWRVKAETICWAQETLRALEAEEHE